MMTLSIAILYPCSSMQNPRDPHLDLPLMKNDLPETNGSHAYLNAITRYKNSGVSKDHYEKSQMSTRYTGRTRFIGLMRHRDRNEEKVLDYVKAGKYMKGVDHPEKHQVARIMFERAHQYRSRSKNVQKEMEKVRAKSSRVALEEDPKYLLMVSKQLERHNTLFRAKEAANMKYIKMIDGSKKKKKQT